MSRTHLERVRAQEAETSPRVRLLADFVERRVLPAFDRHQDAREETFSLRPSSSDPRHFSPHVWRLDLPGRASLDGEATAEPLSLILRAVFGWPWSLRWRRLAHRLEESRAIQQWLGERGFRVPRAALAARGFDGRLLRHFWCSAEERVEGVEPDRGNPAHLEAAFRVLGQLHSLRESRWGRPDAAGRAPYGPRRFGWKLQKRAGSLFKRLEERRGLDLPRGLRRTLRDWMVQSADALVRQMGQRPFSLIHGDFSPSNLLIEPSGELCLLDFGHARFAPAGFEFLDALFIFCFAHPSRAALAAKAYFDHAPADIGAQLRDHEGFLVLRTALFQFAHFNEPDRLDWRQCRENRSLPADAAQASLERLMSAAPGLMAQGADSDWPAVMKWLRANKAFESALTI
jgi:hypothetical protein